jgi:GntR family transcriptional regulator
MEFRIDPSSRLPIWRQLSRQLREAVARGRLAPEDRLPSVRDLSKAELTKKVRKERLQEMLDQLLTEAVHLGFSAEEVTGLVMDRAKQFHWRGEG